MKVLRRLTWLFLIFTPALPAVADYDEGIEYKRLASPVATVDSSKVEVLELFWYGCPHCYHFEPHLNAWLKNKPKNVVFVRVPAIFRPDWKFHAQAYYTAEALGVVEKVHDEIFSATQTRRLKTLDDVRNIFVKKGVKAADFDDAWGSFGVNTRVRQAADLTQRYKISGVPSVVINGTYVTDGTLANGLENIMKVADYLIKKESASIK